MKSKIAVIVQCRLSSTRFPEKATKILGNKTVLAWALTSMHKVKADRYFVATDEASFDVLKPICDENDFECFAGSLENVLDRFCKLIEKIDVDIIVRATADNPYLFYEAAQASLDLFIKNAEEKHPCDYLTFSGLPHGCGVEIINAKSLLKAAAQTDLPYDKEHVGPALYNHKESFKCEFVPAPKRYNFPLLRTTIDTYSDYLRAWKLCEYVADKRAHTDLENKISDLYSEPYSTEEILQALDSTFVTKPVILCPSVKKGYGTGHLHRCLSVAAENKSFVYIPENATLSEINETISLYKQNGLKDWQIISKLPDGTYNPIIISDEFALTQENLDLYENAASLISIDEGSDFTDRCDYLLDIIPSYKLNRKANYTDSSFIRKPENKRTEKKSPEEFTNILICMGGEDPAGFTGETAKAFAEYFEKSIVTAIVSESSFEILSKNENTNDRIKYVKAIPELREKLFEYDLVITHYGLTAFEALYAGCGIILLPTTKLHEKLAEKYGFVCICGKITSQEISMALNSKKLYPEAFFSAEKKSLAEFIDNTSEGQRLYCPVCQKKNINDKVVSRNSTRTYRRCSDCSMIYISWTMDEKKEYKKSYFFEEYKKQYGKTYQEDFESIKAQGNKRLSVIKSMTSVDSKTILDIGCAYGPFLSAAKDYNLNPFGTDISSDAVTYVQNELRFPSTVAAFPDIDVEQEFGIKDFDVITMWYVIEHFKNLDSVLSKVSSILKNGGIFAFSTPSAQGISAKSDWDLFFQRSPTDHYSVWEPSKADKILSRYGLKIERIVSTGHHPERFPSIKKTCAKKGSLQWKLTDKISKAKKLGDTVEIYCRKK